MKLTAGLWQKKNQIRWASIVQSHKKMFSFDHLKVRRIKIEMCFRLSNGKVFIFSGFSNNSKKMAFWL